MFNLPSLTSEIKKSTQPSSATSTKQQHSQHHTLITLIHTKTTSLSKLISKAPRKHKDILGVLDEANDALAEFKDISWPPEKERVEELLEVPSWLLREDDATNVSDGEQQASKVSTTSADTGSSNSVHSTNSQRERREAAVDALEKELQEISVEDQEEREELRREVLSAADTAGISRDVDGDRDGDDYDADDKQGSAETDDADDIMDAIENDIKAKKSQTQKSDGEAAAGSAVETKQQTDNTTNDAPSSQQFEQQKAAAIQKFESIVQKKSKGETPQSMISVTPNTTNANTKPSSSDTRRLSNVDAAAMEPMHPAIITTLHGLCTIISSESKTPKMAEMALECITILTNNRYVSGVAGGRMKLEQQRKMIVSEANNNSTNPAASGNVAAAPGHDGRDGGLSFLGYVVESITRASESSSEQVQSCMAKALLSIMTCPKCGVHEAAMLQAVRSTFHVYLVGKTVAGKEMAKRTLVDMLKSVFNRMEAYDVMNQKKEDEAIPAVGTAGSGDEGTEATAQTATTNGTNSGVENEATSLSPVSKKNDASVAAANSIGAFASQYHTDSYLLFRALCKLSSKTLPGDENVVGMASTGTTTNFFSTAQPVDPLALNSKILSLELILAVFEHCGDAFRNGEKFIYAVQSYLCVSLLKNCMSNQTSVAHLSLKIFLLLVKKFKTHLKSEIEVFVANIFLRVLESPNSPFEQKVLVLEALRALCADPQMLTQLFLNYDCDFDAVNLYKDIVHHVTRISARACAPSNSATVTKKDLDQEIDLSRTGLEVLVVILRSFLKALDLPGGDDVFDENDGSSSLSLLRQNLKLDIKNESDFDDKISNRNHSSADTMSDKVDSNSELHRMGSSSGFAEKIVDAFDKKRTAEQNFEIGMVKFTLSLKSGLQFFIESGFVQLDARDMARFLFENKERLDKTQTGEVLGKETDAAFVKDAEATSEKGGKGFFLRVLHHYVDLMNFDGLMFDDAIRLFLSGFRLPGEAQKVSLQHMHEFKRLQHLESPSLQRLFAVYLRLIESWKNSPKDIHGKTQMYSLTQTLHSF
jgi:hypothetical protein